MANGDILSDFGINLLEEEIDDVIFQTNEFLTDATFTGAQGPFWWILQMCMALAALFSIVMAAGIAYKMMVKHEPLDVMKLLGRLPCRLSSAGGIRLRTRVWRGAGTTGVFWTFCPTSRIASGRTPMTCTKLKLHRYRTGSRKFNSSSMCVTRCTRTCRRRRMSPTRAHPIPT